MDGALPLLPPHMPSSHGQVKLHLLPSRVLMFTRYFELGQVDNYTFGQVDNYTFGQRNFVVLWK
jgi:hypothetical protein